MQNGTATKEDHLVVSYKTTHTLTSNWVLWYLSKGIKKLCPYKNLHMDVYSSFIYNVKIWTQPRRPSVGGWINKLWYTQIMEYYSVLKRSKLSSQEGTWRKLKCIIQREKSQSEKAT